ncbi:ABC transporter permease [Leuconostoc mesenteroides]|uniref:ABC transporter permease n=1 Tax=Leuconostoc mesenteroides TaxID=1245 RepID=UPI0021A4B612|nr:ABC transporter permease [Leuconostoc mesenteroides]MCT3053877.1 ABC transporter permease [Leuconostoc mesenteroides]
MIKALKVLCEQIRYTPFIFRMVRFGNKSSYQNMYLGQLWRVLNPILQVSVYFAMFGTGLRTFSNRPGGALGFLAWMLLGMGAWQYTKTGIMRGSRSISAQLNLSTKVKFPLTVFPAIEVASQIWTIITLGILSMIVAHFSNLHQVFNWWEALYFFIAMNIFTYSIALFSSTIEILIPDYKTVLSTILGLGMWVAGVILPLDNMNNLLGSILRLSPFYYLVYGFRDSLLTNDEVFDSVFIDGTIIFWAVTLIFLVVGTHLHYKFKNLFSEYK